MDLGHTIGNQFFLYLVPFRIDFNILILVITVSIVIVYLWILRKRLKNLSMAITKSQQAKIKIKIIETSQTPKLVVDPVQLEDRFCSFCGEKIGVDTYYCDRCGGKQ